MQKTLRIVVALPGVMFLVSGLNWLFSPASAAEGLGMPLLDGVARSTQIGDIGAFFFGASAMILLGSFTARVTWLYGASMLIGGAALMRVAAWAFHGAEFATQFIVAEVVMTALLLVGAVKITPNTRAEG